MTQIEIMKHLLVNFHAQVSDIKPSSYHFMNLIHYGDKLEFYVITEIGI
jgi:hypothetical protein